MRAKERMKKVNEQEKSIRKKGWKREKSKRERGIKKIEREKM